MAAVLLLLEETKEFMETFLCFAGGEEDGKGWSTTEILSMLCSDDIGYY